jgi:NAD dependent epimerase/dehydratase
MKLLNQKVLVTGADGFIGSHLVETLLAEGAKVRALSLYNSSNHWGWLEAVPQLSQVEVITGDIRDVVTCQKITRDIDIVFHLAALISIPYSYRAPEAYLETNIKGTANLCQAALDNGCKRFIHTSTSEVYGTALYIPIDEKHPLQPQSPYSASKIGADSMAMSYHYAFDLPLTIVRPFNTYGPRQSARAVIPTIITQIASGKEEIALGDVRPTRDFTYVVDTCKSFIALSQSQQAIGETVNVGTQSEVSMLELFDKIAALMNSPVKRIDDHTRKRPVKSEVLQLCCNNEKLFRLTGFKPPTTLEEGLLKTIQWFTQDENLKNYKTGIYNV